MCTLTICLVFLFLVCYGPHYRRRKYLGVIALALCWYIRISFVTPLHKFTRRIVAGGRTDTPLISIVAFSYRIGSWRKQIVNVENPSYLLFVTCDLT